MEQNSSVYLFIDGPEQRDDVSRCLSAAGYAVRRFDSKEALVEALGTAPANAVAAQAGPPPSLDVLEKQAIMAAMTSFGNNRSQVAQHLGIGRTTLYRKLKAYGTGVSVSDKD